MKVYGAIYSAESCSYDPRRGVIVVPNRGVPPERADQQRVGLVHQPRRLRPHGSLDRRPESRPIGRRLTPPLVLNEPYGSDIANGMLYVADRDGGTTPNEPSVAVVRRFNLKTGAPAGEIRVEKSTWFNDIEVADDGTVYATQTGAGGQNPDASTWQVWKITPDGTASSSCRVRRFGSRTASRSIRKGNIVVVNIGEPMSPDVFAGRQAAQDRERGAGRATTAS